MIHAAIIMGAAVTVTVLSNNLRRSNQLYFNEEQRKEGK
jgi:hypothetical protein